MERLCHLQSCGKEFRVPPDNSAQKYCKRSCYVQARREASELSHITKTCEGERCNETFKVLKSDEERAKKQGKATKRFCSYTCSGKATTGPNNPVWTEKVILSCQNCSLQFPVRPSEVRDPAFCSRDCMGKYWSKTKTGEDNPSWKGGDTEVVCSNGPCSKTFTRKRCNDTLYCSMECFRQHQFGDRQGSRWKPDSKWGMAGTKSGKRKDLGIFVRSAWEANYARFLNFLKDRGEIKDWKYESKTFEFLGIKKGTRFYTPDFEVTGKDDSIEYHEVKGYRHPQGETALKRMKIYHPKEKIVLIDESWFKQAKRQGLDGLIANWEY